MSKALKHELAPGEWSDIMAHNIREYLRRRGYSEKRIGYLMDDLVAEGWVRTMTAMTYSGFDREHENAESYLLTSVMNSLREWATVNGPESVQPEPQYGRTSGGGRMLRKVANGEADDPLVRNQGWRSILPGPSLDQPVGDDSSTLGDLVPIDQSDRLLEVECRIDLLAAIENDRAQKAALMRLNGMTFKEIGQNIPAKFNGGDAISRERVRQMFAKHVTPKREELN